MNTMNTISAEEVKDIKRRLQMAIELLQPVPSDCVVQGMNIPTDPNALIIPLNHIKDTLYILAEVYADLKKTSIEEYVDEQK